MRPHTRPLSTKSLAGLLAVSLALVGAALGSAAPAAAEPSAGSPAQAERQRVLDFWTPERMMQAQPGDYVRDPSTGAFERVPESDTPGPRANSRSQGNVIGATWTGGGLVQRTTGRVFLLLGGEPMSCSGSVVRDSSEQTSLVLTAAHCVYDNATGTFADFWMFVPDYAANPATGGLTESYCGTTPYGCWTPQGLTLPRDYVDQSTFNDAAAMNDVAFVTVGPDLTRGQLDAVVGTQEIAFAAQAQGTDTYVFGYPGEKKYTGDSLVYSAGRLRFDPHRDRLTYRIGSHMNLGSSGGPWIVGFDPQTGAGVTVSVTSYGYVEQAALYGPIFDEATQALHAAADGFTGGPQIVP